MRITRRSVLAGAGALAFVLLPAIEAEAWTHGSAGATPAAAWHQLPIGGGGYVTGADSCSDGTLVVRSDSAGAFIWNSGTSRWDMLATYSNFDATWVAANYPANPPGSVEVRIAPSNCNTMYADIQGALFKTTDHAAHWTQLTAWGSNAQSANCSWRGLNNQMAVDPANANVVWGSYPEDSTTCTVAQDLKYTTDGGATWNTISTGVIPQPTIVGAPYNIAFDSSVGTTGGKTKNIYVSSNGNGVYFSNDAGATFTKISGAVTQAYFCSSTVSSTGVYAVITSTASTLGTICSYGGGGVSYLWEYSGGLSGSWTNLLSSPQNIDTITFNPGNANQLVSTVGPYIDVWNSGVENGFILGTDNFTTVPWLQNVAYMGGGGFVFLPGSQQAIKTSGAGVYKMTIPVGSFSSFVWTDDVVGIENLSPQGGVSVPPGTTGGEQVGVSVFDWGYFFLTPHLDTTPTYAISAQCPYCAYVPTQGASAIGVRNGNSNWALVLDMINDKPAITTTWGTPADVSGTPPVAGDYYGGFAVDTANAWLYQGGTGVYFTTDGGATFTQITSSLCSGLSWGFTGPHAAVADGANSSTWYFASSGTGGGMWKMTGDGATCTQVYSGFLNGQAGQLKAAPGIAGDLWWYANPAYGGSYLEHSTDGGVNWTRITAFTVVDAVGLGPTEPGKSYPTIYVFGENGTTWGVWKSTDEAVTWTSLGIPYNSLFGLIDITPDPTNIGWVYGVFMSGDGFAYYH